LKVAVFVGASYVTVPEILDPPVGLSVNVVPVTVELCRSSLNVAVTDELTATPGAPSAGVLLVTVGGVLSACAAVVNDHTLFEANALPAMSLTPVVTVAL
jgi:hypothetical protein